MEYSWHAGDSGLNLQQQVKKNQVQVPMCSVEILTQSLKLPKNLQFGFVEN